MKCFVLVAVFSLLPLLTAAENPYDFWSLRPLTSPSIPVVDRHDAPWTRNAIDAFIVSKLRERKLTPSKAAERATIMRRLSFDLVGLPPTPEEAELFLGDTRPDAYEQLVERLLASPRYGERWARHWLDVVHYGDTHGYDKDKPRPHAWPYRDYVIRSFNEDKPYDGFVLEQLAGDVLNPLAADAVIATGFIAAGPWDFIGHAEVPESKIDGQIARNLDRDDMLTSTMNTFMSTTVQCARCHDHKFDPVTQREYYSMQSVFAALDRADRSYDPDPAVAQRRRDLTMERDTLQARRKDLELTIVREGGTELAALELQIAQLRSATSNKTSAAFGYHSALVAQPDQVKWVQVDLNAPAAIESVVLVGCHDDFAGIGDGFGFPVRFKVEISQEADFRSGSTTLLDQTDANVPNPGITPQVIPAAKQEARFVRVTATRLALRQNDYMFALAELMVFGKDGSNLARGKVVDALDSIEASPRWAKQNLTDGTFTGSSNHLVAAEQARLTAAREALIENRVDKEVRVALVEVNKALAETEAALNALPEPAKVYAGTVYHGSGAFSGSGGKPRVIRVLQRGDVTRPQEDVSPGALPLIPGVPSQFELAAGAPEGERRLALARWIVHRDNPLTWRTAVNRVWQHHMGRGLVATPNDFGRMGARPSHPELLNWLATRFRDDGGSVKNLHRLIVNSATYRQTSEIRAEEASQDAENTYWWRMSRRRLEAEEVRDTVLLVAGRLDQRMYGRGFEDFVVEKPEHSPHYRYQLHDPNDPKSHRRAIYRFIVRSQQSPFMTTLDCADPSQSVGRRNETLTSLQALALLNNKLVIAMASQFAERVETVTKVPEEQVSAAYAVALGRAPSSTETRELVAFTREHGLANMCRLVLNLNEFVFVD